MDYLKEKVAYLKGLAEGMQISDATNEGKLFKAIIDVLEDVAVSVDDIEDVQEQLSDQVDEIDEDLAEVEEMIYGDDECSCEDCCDEDDDEASTTFECPHCGESIVLEEEDINKETIVCPHCHNEIEIEWTCDCEECKDEEDEK